MVSCSPPNEKAHPAYNKAENEKKNGNYSAAAEGYQEYLCFNRRSAITHYKLAKLYGDRLENPFLSAYHFREYLKYEPQSPDKEAIEAWISLAEKAFAKEMQNQYPETFPSQTEYITLKENQQKLINYILKIRKQNIALKQQGSRSTFKGNTKSRKTQVIADGIQEVYTVKSGDSLRKISRSVYGTSKYYKLIFEANRDILPSEAKLNIGQKLQIPKIKEVSSAPAKNEEIIEAGEVIME